MKKKEQDLEKEKDQEKDQKKEALPAEEALDSIPFAGTGAGSVENGSAVAGARDDRPPYEDGSVENSSAGKAETAADPIAETAADPIADIGDERVRELVAAIRGGEWKPELESLLVKAFNYEHDLAAACTEARDAGHEEREAAIAAAREEGRAEGRLEAKNERIEEYMFQAADSDGIPHPGSGQAASAPRSIFDLARGAKL